MWITKLWTTHCRVKNMVYKYTFLLKNVNMFTFCKARSHEYFVSIMIKWIILSLFFEQFLKVLTLKMALSVIFIIIFVISAPKYSNIPIDSEIGDFPFSELYPFICNEIYKN